MEVSKHLPIQIEKSKSDEFDARFIMSAATPDRVADTIEPSAYKSAIHSEKIIALWQHDAEKPVGYWTNIKADGDRLTGYLKVAGTNLGLMIKQLIADGVPLGASIGFRGKGEPNKKGGIHFKEIDIFETSIVSIPAHPRAMQIAKSFGLGSVVEPDESPVKSDHKPQTEEIKRAKAAILAANRALRR